MFDAAQAGSGDWYGSVDEEIRGLTGASVGFTNVLAEQPYRIDDATLAGFVDRYALIRQFWEITRDVFLASIRGEADPAVAHSVLGGQPPERGVLFHLGLTERQLRLPVFFRTDEAAPGALAEIQPPGCGWEIADQVARLYARFPEHFGPPRRSFGSPVGRLASAMRAHVGGDPVVHHVTDNASRPHGALYTLQRLREEGVRHYGWDPVHWKDCTFVRGHEFYGLRYNGFFDDWMDACEAGDLFFDHPPTPLYDAKIIMAWPFWEATRAYYPDEVRGLFPHTDVITEDGFHLADGTQVSLSDYCRLGERKRVYYFKFAGHHPTLNWGSRGVYYSGSLSATACRTMLDRILADRAAGTPWIAQEARTHPETARGVTREGTEVEFDAYTKLSGFYTPDGLVSVLAMQDHSRKVHGSPHTVVSIVH